MAPMNEIPKLTTRIGIIKKSQSRLMYYQASFFTVDNKKWRSIELSQISHFSDRVRSGFEIKRVEHEKIKFISTSGNVIFRLLYKHTNNDVFQDFPKISEDFPKLFRRLDERLWTFFEHFPKITESSRRVPRRYRWCFDHTTPPLSTF